MAGARERARCPLPGAALLCACSLPVLLVLLAFAVRAPGAAAANVPNPEPALIERWEPCEPNTGVTVIVDDQKIGTGKIYVGCAPGAQADGVEALQNAGFELRRHPGLRARLHLPHRRRAHVCGNGVRKHARQWRLLVLLAR